MRVCRGVPLLLPNKNEVHGWTKRTNREEAECE